MILIHGQACYEYGAPPAHKVLWHDLGLARLGQPQARLRCASSALIRRSLITHFWLVELAYLATDSILFTKIGYRHALFKCLRNMYAYLDVEVFALDGIERLWCWRFDWDGMGRRGQAMYFREGVQRVEVYNEALVVYLHDPSHAEAILKLRPPSLFDHGDVEPGKDKALKKVVEQGLLVTYFLRQDDSIRVDVAIGPPLTKAEVKKLRVPIMKPTQTFISIPSGRLRIDTANTFRLSDEAQSYAEAYQQEHGQWPADDNLAAFGLEDASGEISVPPGDYVLTLHRVDFDAMDDDDDDNEFDGPGEFITLTPIGELARPKRIPPVLEYGAGYSRVAHLRASKIVNGVFYGRVCGGSIVNMTWPHATKLGLRRGQRLRITHEDKPYDAVFLGSIELRADPELASMIYPKGLAHLQQAHPGLLTAAIHDNSTLGIALLWLQTLEAKRDLTAERGSVVVIEPCPDFILPAPPAGPPPQGEFKDGAVHGAILAAADCGVELSCNAKVLKGLRCGKADELTLHCGDVRLPILLLPNAEHRQRPYHIVNSIERGDDVLFRDIFSYMAGGGDEVFRAFVGAERIERLMALVNEYQKGCTFTPTDGYQPKDPVRAAEIRPQCIVLWRDGIARFGVAGAMSATFARHWDDPSATTLSCRVIKNKGANLLKDAVGKDFVLTKGC